jgi:hypothetical protein
MFNWDLNALGLCSLALCNYLWDFLHAVCAYWYLVPVTGIVGGYCNIGNCVLSLQPYYYFKFC